MKTNKSVRHVTHGSVLDDLGLPPERVLALRIKADLHRSVMKQIDRHRYSPRDLVRILREPAPRVSELLHGKIGSTSIEKLLGYAAKLGMSARLAISKRPQRDSTFNHRRRYTYVKSA